MELKKSEEANLDKKVSVLRTLGIMAALSLTLVAFQWRMYEAAIDDSNLGGEEAIEEEEIPIAILEEKPPEPEPPKKEEQVVLEIIEDESDEEETMEADDSEADEEIEIEEVDEEDEEVEEEEIFAYAEEMPAFPGGETAMLKYMGKNTRYPQLAKESNIQGTVYVGFVVGKDGSINDVKVLRGIGGGCDEEAIRVVKNMPKWTAGKQRGKPVKVSFRLPFKFNLQ